MGCHVTTGPKPGYRKCVGILLLNGEHRVLVGRRIDAGNNGGWQMPQGGIDDNEDEHAAALREMSEEIGTRSADLLMGSNVWRSYDLPAEIAQRMWNGAYLGQTQRWMAFRFTGVDREINIHTRHPEFSQWQWADPDDIIDLIVPFKRDVYLSVVDEFRHLWAES
ncbi:MAG: RNA pyrophosphohydrolase [Geminicoccaceae bacterium]|nr:RNA pyrophosphohydrolase [Geminicoccaceae bacterium]MCB9942746.1 RNA pyrophosphohydrolase [Geminicoccaceae bacterium]